jgi:hypothetical protein
VKAYLKTLFLLVSVVFLSSCSSSLAPTPTPQAVNLSGFWTGTLETTNCPTNGTGKAYLTIRGDRSSYTAELTANGSIPLTIIQMDSDAANVSVYDDLEDSGYSLSMDLTLTAQNALVGTFSEVGESIGCNRGVTLGTVSFTK